MESLEAVVKNYRIYGSRDGIHNFMRDTVNPLSRGFSFTKMDRYKRSFRLSALLVLWVVESAQLFIS